MQWSKSVALALAVMAGAAASGTANADQFLFTEIGANKTWLGDPYTDTFSIFHNIAANDADYNPGEGSAWAWFTDHTVDTFSRVAPGTGSGFDQQYTLGTGGRTHYDYPKHIAVYNGEVYVMSRNDGTVWRYDDNGNQIGSFSTGYGTAQGIATDGTDLYVSVWDGSQSLIQRYNSSLILQNTYANPTGGSIAFDNIFDMVYDQSTGRWVGLITSGEFGTGTSSNQVVEFTMGGSVINNYTIGFQADGVGVPAPASLATLGLALATTARRRRKPAA